MPDDGFYQCLLSNLFTLSGFMEYSGSAADSMPQYFDALAKLSPRRGLSIFLISCKGTGIHMYKS